MSDDIDADRGHPTEPSVDGGVPSWLISRVDEGSSPQRPRVGGGWEPTKDDYANDEQAAFDRQVELQVSGFPAG